MNNMRGGYSANPRGTVYHNLVKLSISLSSDKPHSPVYIIGLTRPGMVSSFIHGLRDQAHEGFICNAKYHDV